MSTHVGHGDAAEVVPRPEAVDAFGSLEREWDALAERSGGIFATALWSRLWWEHFGGQRELLLHAVRSSDGLLAAVLPLYAWRRRLPRVIRFLGHGPGDELGPVHERGCQMAAGHALATTLEGLDWDVFFGEQLPGDEDWHEVLGGREWRREASPSLRLPGTWDEYLAARSRNFREQLRRREAAIRREGDIATRLADATTLDRDLDALFALHRARWGSTPTDFGDTPFHRELAREALGRGWLRLRLLELDGRPIAAWHGFEVGTVCSYYQAGRDPAFERHSLGFVLMAHSIRSAIAEGATEYRFGRGDEAFKTRFTSCDSGLESILLRRGVIGTSAYAAGRAARTMRRLLSR
jgi:CelD/BcsL family acetyltransferase involved in cellulose biosynthesis